MRLALAGDTMLGRGVAERLGESPPESLFDPAVAAVVADADAAIVNLECCISERGRPTPGRVFHFRAPPAAIEALLALGVDCVTLANNHALDYGEAALADTLELLAGAGIAAVGAGADVQAARAPVTVEAAGERLRVVALADHPAGDAATEDRAGIAYADLERGGVPDWPTDAITSSTDPVLVSPHWGPNMTPAPLPHVRQAAAELVGAGAALVAGHSAHVFHGAAGRVLFDLGDFVDDYRVEPVLRNDLGLLWLVDLREGVLERVEAVPLALDFCHTRLAGDDERAWIARRLADACAELGTAVRAEGERLVVDGAG